MKLLKWREKTWWHRALLVLTVIAVVLLASHPELRLLLPLLDSLGLDLLLLLVGSQILDAVRPYFSMLHRLVLRPAVGRVYALTIFMLGIAGPYVDGRLAHFVGPRKVSSEPG